MKSFAPAILPAMFLAACATDPEMTSAQRFHQADGNGDSLVSREEATDLLIGEAFARYDTNGDGVVDAAEYVAGGGKAADFAKMDASGTGRLTLEEARKSPVAVEHMAVPFDEADVNGNGAITLEEFEAYLKRLDAAVR